MPHSDFTADKRYIYYMDNTENNQKFVRYDTQKRTTKVLDDRYKTKEKFYYDDPYVMNGKVFYSVADYTSGQRIGWRSIPDLWIKYFVKTSERKSIKYTQHED